MSPSCVPDPLPDWPVLRDSWWQRLKWTRIGCLFGAHRGCAGECACRCHHREIRDAWQARLEAELLQSLKRKGPVTTIHAHILLEEDDPPQVGTPWLGFDGVNIAVQIGHPSSAYAVLQGTPEDMDRLAETARRAAEHGRQERHRVDPGDQTVLSLPSGKAARSVRSRPVKVWRPDVLVPQLPQ